MNGSLAELWGLPGAGKTTIAAELVKRGAVQVLPLRSYRESAVGNPLEVVSLALRLTVSGLFDRDLFRTSIRQKATEGMGLSLIEEGMVHALWRVLWRRPELARRPAWRAYLQRNDGPVLILRAPPAVAQKRIRGKARLGVINQALRDAPLDGDLWQRAGEAFDLIRTALHQSGRSVLELDAEETSVAAICDQIEEALSDRPHDVSL